MLGAYDGIEKTPTWASEICGCPVQRIEEFARIMGAGNKVSNTHNLRRAHTDGDNLQWLREAWASPLFMSPADAKELGIESGDVVKVYNQYGACLRELGEQPACVAACPMRVIEFGDVDELAKKCEGQRVTTELPVIDATGELRENSVYVIKDCMLDGDFDKVVL